MIRATILGCLLLTGAGVPAAAGTGALPLLFEQRSPVEYQVRGAGFGVRVEPAGMTLVTGAGAATLRWSGASVSVLQALA